MGGSRIALNPLLKRALRRLFVSGHGVWHSSDNYVRTSEPVWITGPSHCEPGSKVASPDRARVVPPGADSLRIP